MLYPDVYQEEMKSDLGNKLLADIRTIKLHGTGEAANLSREGVIAGPSYDPRSVFKSSLATIKTFNGFMRIAANENRAAP